MKINVSNGKIKQGSDFCRVVRTSKGQQILLALDNDKEGEAIMIGSATFVTERGNCLVRLEIDADDETYVGVLESVLTVEEEQKLADKVCALIQDDLFTQLYPQYRETSNMHNHNPH
jgi:hypothetical protein